MVSTSSSEENDKHEQDPNELPVDSSTMMMDSYVGGIRTASFVNDATTTENPTMFPTKQTAAKPRFQPTERITDTVEPIDDYSAGIKSTGFPLEDDCADTTTNQTDEAKIINLTCTDEIDYATVNATDDNNAGYEGLSILPWEDFVFNPRVLNDLFYEETNQKITFDPEEVNVFFHGKNVMPPSIGDISENGKSWNIETSLISELREVRQWLTERCSVFGVTLQYREKRFAKPERAPCLVMLDPEVGTLGDQLYTALTKAMDSLHNKRRFCVEVNLNPCVERWCRRVLLTDCRAVGAKLVITNGEEYLDVGGAESAVCCLVCCPVWAIQTAIYKLHRVVVYDDFRLTFDAEEMFLHGAYEDPRCQRQQIFASAEKSNVFRTQHLSQTGTGVLQSLGTYQFVSVKKCDNDDNIGEQTPCAVLEYDTSFGSLVKKRKDKVLNKERKQFSNTKTVINASDPVGRKVSFRLEQESKPYVSAREHTNEAFTDSDEESYHIPTICELPDNGSTTGNPTLIEFADIISPRELDKTAVSENVEDGLAKLFSPRLDTQCPYQTTMDSNNDEIVSNDNSTDIHAFSEESSEESEETTESEPEEDNDNNQAGKEDMLVAMMKIEMTLKPIDTEDTFHAKDITDLTNKEKLRKQGTGKKKKKSKTNVKTALKDLMKTTSYSKEQTPSAKDNRYLKATTKIKAQKKSKNDNKTMRKACEDTSVHNENETLADVKSNKCGQIINCVTKLDNKDAHDPKLQDTSMNEHVTPVIAIGNTNTNTHQENNSSPSNDKLVRTNENSVKSNRPGKHKAMKTVNLFQYDSSSSDGEDVEIIYQSPQPEEAKLCDHTQNDLTNMAGVDKKFDDIETVISEDKIAKQTKCVLFDLDKEHRRPESRTFLEDITDTNTDCMFRQNVNFKSRCDTSLDDPSVTIPDKQRIKSKRSKSLDPTMLEGTRLGPKVDVNNWDHQDSGTSTGSQAGPSIVPRLNLNGNSTNKLKRGTKKNSSNRKYLSTSISHKQKK